MEESDAGDACQIAFILNRGGCNMSKLRLQSMLLESIDRIIHQNLPTLQFGRKWDVLKTLETVKRSVRQREVFAEG